MDIPDEMDEKLREFSCTGDVDAVSSLLQQGANVNSQNKMNGWTALHWAAKRGNRNIALLLMKRGADKLMKNFKGETAADLALENKDLHQVLSADTMCNADEEDKSHADDQKSNSHNTQSFVPNYMAHPQFPYTKKGEYVDNQPAFRSIESPGVNGFDTPPPSLEKQSSVHKPVDSAILEKVPLRNKPFPIRGYQGISGMRDSMVAFDGTVHLSELDEDELVVKVREAFSKEQDFIEVEIGRDSLTYKNLLDVCCSELKIDPTVVRKVRKLPNTIVRKDKDVRRLVMFQELEIVCAPVVSGTDEVDL